MAIEGPLTGSQAASGIGKDTVFSFAEAGASRVVFANCNEKGARKAATDSKQYATNQDYIATAIHVDITDEDSVQKVVDYTQKSYHRIDYFVHSAGVSPNSHTKNRPLGTSLTPLQDRIQVFYAHSQRLPRRIRRHLEH
jgi:NAD(P)-dependent dehydrogenase (short-subunit alcohol dehydrogenase family)